MFLLFNLNLPQIAIDRKNNSNTKLEQVFFFKKFLCGNELFKMKNQYIGSKEEFYV
jgi:hypothetical protein